MFSLKKPDRDDVKPAKKDAERLFVKRLAIRADDKNSVYIGLRKAYVWPTQKGLYYVIVLVAMFLWSVNYALSLGYALTFLTAVIALVAAVLTVNNLISIRLSAGAQPSFFAKEPAFFYLHLHNNKQDVAVRITARRNGLSSLPVTLSTGQGGVLKIPLDDTSRGRKSLDYCRLSSDYPVGIFRSWTWVFIPTTLLIYPQPKGDLPLPFLPQHQGIEEGQVDLHGAEDFNDLKSYQTGDNIRHIVWRKALLGDVRVKTFQDLAGQQCVLDFNDESLRYLDVEDKLSQLCRWVLLAEKQGTKYALRLPSWRTDFAIGAAHQARCLEALACY
ncbi:MAG: hypothetical protein CR975_02705 [Gammaproteobacteria bacterium]|nr:MAG: hypothetical protein CR975_02705 [Gammaproteobacteria bacterium]